MKSSLRIALTGTPEQFERLRTLQVAFAEVCNAIAPVVQSTRCWNRVALHHLVYREMRLRFPALGSQMICNAIYSVSRAARQVLQHPKSPWYVAKRPGTPLPLLRFASSAPVYFDRHTLSVKSGALSLFTLDGRMRFEVRLAPADEARFHSEKLIEVILLSTAHGFDLAFRFARPQGMAGYGKAVAANEFRQHLIVIPPGTSVPIAAAHGQAAEPLVSRSSRSAGT